MYTKFTTMVLFLIGSSILFNFAILDFSKKEKTNTLAQEGIAVIELFTSQGCSSCPSADRVLSQLIDEAEQHELPVYGLSFHVDYWNRLGWKAPYSQRAFTERQYEYARHMGKRGVYTPQMVVNGVSEFVGSNKPQAKKEIEKARGQAAKSQIKITSFSRDQLTLKLTYEASETVVNTWLNIALVERGIATQVTRGENHGRKLTNDNVVRTFRQIDLDSGGEIELELPDELDLDKSSLILYSQDQSTLKITSATRMALGN